MMSATKNVMVRHGQLSGGGQETGFQQMPLVAPLTYRWKPKEC